MRNLFAGAVFVGLFAIGTHVNFSNMKDILIGKTKAAFAKARMAFLMKLKAWDSLRLIAANIKYWRGGRIAALKKYRKGSSKYFATRKKFAGRVKTLQRKREKALRSAVRAKAMHMEALALGGEQCCKRILRNIFAGPPGRHLAGR